MKRSIPLAVAVLLLQGCIADLGFRYGSTTPSATQPSVGPGGGSITSGGVGVRVSDGPSVGAAIGAGVLSVILQGTPSKQPALEPSRPVQQQDCTGPLETAGANLRCK